MLTSWEWSVKVSLLFTTAYEITLLYHTSLSHFFLHESHFSSMNSKKSHKWSVIKSVIPWITLLSHFQSVFIHFFFCMRKQHNRTGKLNFNTDNHIKMHRAEQKTEKNSTSFHFKCFDCHQWWVMGCADSW